MKLDFSSGMTHFCLGGVHIRLLEGVYLKVSKFKFLTNAIQHDMEVIFKDNSEDPPI